MTNVKRKAPASVVTIQRLHGAWIETAKNLRESRAELAAVDFAIETAYAARLKASSKVPRAPQFDPELEAIRAEHSAPLKLNELQALNDKKAILAKIAFYENSLLKSRYGSLSLPSPSLNDLLTKAGLIHLYNFYQTSNQASASSKTQTAADAKIKVAKSIDLAQDLPTAAAKPKTGPQSAPPIQAAKTEIRSQDQQPEANPLPSRPAAEIHAPQPPNARPLQWSDRLMEIAARTLAKSKDHNGPVSDPAPQPARSNNDQASPSAIKPESPIKVDSASNQPDLIKTPSIESNPAKMCILLSRSSDNAGQPSKQSSKPNLIQKPGLKRRIILRPNMEF